MDASKHTPGPWGQNLTLDHDGDELRVVRDGAPAPGFHVAMVYGHGGDYEHDTARQANGRLIAAAPELLEALEMAHDIVVKHGNHGFAQLMLDVISKAKGNPPTMPGEVVVGSEEWDARETARLATLKPDGDPISKESKS